MLRANETAHGTYGTYGTYGDSTNVKRALMAKPKGRDYAAARGQNGSQKTEWEDVEWIHLAQDRSDWQVLLKTVRKLRGP